MKGTALVTCGGVAQCSGGQGGWSSIEHIWQVNNLGMLSKEWQWCEVTGPPGQKLVEKPSRWHG